MTPLKGKLIYKLITKQDGKIILPDTAKNRSTASVVVAVNDDGSGIHANDIILHNMRYNGRVEHYIVNGEDHKIMDTDDVFAKVIGGKIIPVKDWIFCKMVIPESTIAGAFNIKDCTEVIVCSVSVNGDKGLPINIGSKYLISGWEKDMQQFQFDPNGDCYLFMKADNLVAEVIPSHENVIPMFKN